MINDIEKLTEIFEKYDITPNQYYLLYNIHFKLWHNIYRFVNRVNRITEQGKVVTGFELNSEIYPLINKGYLKSWDGSLNIGQYKDNLEVNEQFYKTIWMDTYLAGEELFDVYPINIQIDGKDIKAKVVNKDQYIEKYSKKIGYHIKTHQECIAALQWANKRKAIHYSIKNFIDGEMWKDLIKEYKEKGITQDPNQLSLNSQWA